MTIKEYKRSQGDIADLLWPSLARQILPREVNTFRFNNHTNWR